MNLALGTNVRNSPRSIYYNSNMTPWLYVENCKFFKTRWSHNFQKRLEHNINIANLGYLVEGGSEIYYVVDRDGEAVATRGRNTEC